MPRGSGMAPTRRRNTTQTANTPADLADRLPGHLRQFTPSTDTDDLRGHLAAVADFIRTQGVEDADDAMRSAVMEAAGIRVSDWFRQALTRKES